MMRYEKNWLMFNQRDLREGRAQREHTLLLIGVVVAFSCLAGSTVLAEPPKPFTYVHVIGTGDPTPDDPHEAIVKMDDTIAACDVGSLTNYGLMAFVCSFDGDPNSNGGVYQLADGAPSRSFRREDPLPGQTVGFEKAVIPFGIPALHPTTGDTYLTAFFDLIPGEDAGLSNRPGGRQKGVYFYDRQENTMHLIADTTKWSEPLPAGAVWSDFSTNVAVSKAGAFFAGDYKIKGESTTRQGIFRYVDGKLLEIVGNPASTNVPGRNIMFSKYRGVAANSSTVHFVGESSSCATGRAEGCVIGVYAYHLDTRKLSGVIESDEIFRDFAVEPKKGIFHSSIATNDAGSIALVAEYEERGEIHQGVFLLRKDARESGPFLVLGSGEDKFELLGSPITSFNTVAINARSEVAFVVAHDGSMPPEQGLVFFRNTEEGPRSVFKPGDTLPASLMHPPSADYTTSGYGGLVSGSQALDSAAEPRIFFRHFYQVTKPGEKPAGHSMMVVATLHK